MCHTITLQLGVGKLGAAGMHACMCSFSALMSWSFRSCCQSLSIARRGQQSMGLRVLQHRSAIPKPTAPCIAKKHRMSSTVAHATVATADGRIKRVVAVIGAGAAGLAAAKELRDEGHDVVVFEQGSQLGGVWVYDEHGVDSDVLGKDPARLRVHSSMYAQLRTNLPREIMAYTDLPFHPAAMNLVNTWADRQVSGRPTDSECCSIDSRRFCSHQEVLRYLRAYALYHQLHPLIQFNTRVSAVNLAPASDTNGSNAIHSNGTDAVNSHTAAAAQTRPPRWQLTIEHLQQQQHQASAHALSFDALVVANGHYFEPNLPHIPGMEACPVPQMHSHNYRRPHPFAGKVVLVVGASNSGDDISRELSAYASKVLLSARSWKADVDLTDSKPYGEGHNIHRRPLASHLTEDGCVEFPAGHPSEKIDVIIYCTGYRYTFPFLEDSEDVTEHVTSAGQYVRGLYQHLFPPQLAPWLSFIGLPWKVVPFPQFQVQAKLVARVLSGQAQLPPPNVMEQQAQQHLQSLQDQGLPMRYLHMQNLAQFAYNDALVAMCGSDVQPLPKWRADMYVAAGTLKRVEAGRYRDVVWPAQLESVIQGSAADIEKQLKAIRASLDVHQVA